MQEFSYTNAVLPPPLRVLKLPLRTYTLAHELFLVRFQSPFHESTEVSEEQFNQLDYSAQREALHTAINVCSSTWREIHFDFLWPIKARILRWRRRGLKPEDYALACAEFRNYLNLHRTYPRLSKRQRKKGEEEGRSYGAPLISQLHQFVLTLPEIACLKNPVKMERAAWDFGYSAAVWRYFVAAEMLGGCQIENTDERESRESADNIRNSYNAMMAAWKSAETDDEKAAAIDAYPDLRTSADTEDAVRIFEAKGMLCPA